MMPYKTGWHLRRRTRTRNRFRAALGAPLTLPPAQGVAGTHPFNLRARDRCLTARTAAGALAMPQASIAAAAAAGSRRLCVVRPLSRPAVDGPCTTVAAALVGEGPCGRDVGAQSPSSDAPDHPVSKNVSGAPRFARLSVPTWPVASETWGRESGTYRWTSLRTRCCGEGVVPL